MASLRDRLKPASQRLLFAAERYGQAELANHAAAGAYAFLLSATPAVLIVLAIATALLRDAPAALEGLEGIVAGILGPLDAEAAAKAFFGRPLGTAAAIVGVLSLVWAARLFVVSVQRGIRVIWAAAGRHAPVKESALSFALELAGLFAAVAVLAAAQAARLLAGMAGEALGPFGIKVAYAAAGLAPAIVLLLFVYGSYRFVPAKRPSRRVAAACALLCVASYAALSRAFAFFINSGRYAILYGFFGGLILLLVNVYAFFSLFYFFAELAYVEGHFDALLLGRFRRLTLRAAAGAKVPKPEAALFLPPERLLAAYGRAYGPGETVFEAGSPGRDSYILYRGRIGIYAQGGSRIGALGPGEVFGEMAALLDEARTATTRAIEESYVLAIPPAVFSAYLKNDAEASRDLVSSLSSRLKEANLRLRDPDELAPGEAE